MVVQTLANVGKCLLVMLVNVCQRWPSLVHGKKCLPRSYTVQRTICQKNDLTVIYSESCSDTLLINGVSVPTISQTFPIAIIFNSTSYQWFRGTTNRGPTICATTINYYKEKYFTLKDFTPSFYHVGEI